MGDRFVWDLVVDDLKHAPMATGVGDGSNYRVLIWVAEIDDGNGEGLAFDGGDSGLLGLRADELGRETAGEEHRRGDVLDSPDLHFWWQWSTDSDLGEFKSGIWEWLENGE